jgi:hypothetical protein
MFQIKSHFLGAGVRTKGIATALLWLLSAGIVLAQDGAPTGAADSDRFTAMSRQIDELKALVLKLQARVSDLEDRNRPAAAGSVYADEPAGPGAVAQDSQPQAATTASANQGGAGAGAAAVVASPAPDFNILRGTTFNFLFDGYYGYNFNNPIGRVNLLRAFDVSSNAFSLSQADLVVENAPDPEHGKPFGLRLDLQFGQATATLQGNAANEPRPELYANVFQVYGTYVLPVGGGLTVDFGKWASSLGMEGNYSKDQMNYSRSYWFDFLPFYHMGARAAYKVNNMLTLNYWITNGTNQTEPFNGYKDELFGFNLQPNKNVAWTVNYYLGQEHPDFQYLPGSTQAGLPELQGVPFAPIVNPANGKLHVFDTYVTWAATPKWTLAAEGDYVIERLYTTSAPATASGGALYARYQLAPKWAVAGRSEYLDDRGGLFSGIPQALKDTTVTLDQAIARGLDLKEEWRRDASNHPYFLTDTLGILKKEQNTATLGIVYWFGAKEGAW